MGNSFAGIAGILSVWGYWGGGTAAGLLPEKNKNIEVSSASGEASDGFSEGRMTAEAAKSMMPRFTGVKDR